MRPISAGERARLKGLGVPVEKDAMVDVEAPVAVLGRKCEPTQHAKALLVLKDLIDTKGAFEAEQVTGLRVKSIKAITSGSKNMSATVASKLLSLEGATTATEFDRFVDEANRWVRERDRLQKSIEVQQNQLQRLQDVLDRIHLAATPTNRKGSKA